MCPYREVDHTADWALCVWAPTLPELFTEAARGMYALMGGGGAASDARRRVEVKAEDYESLLVAWLQELLYHTEAEKLVFDAFSIETLTPTALAAEVSGGPAAQLNKIIKAVTYHNLQIRQIPEGYEVTLVFDV